MQISDPWQQLDYRAVLHAIFSERQKRHRISLRGFARMADLSPSTVHNLFALNTHLSRERLKKIVTKIALSKDLKKHCLLTFDRTLATIPSRKQKLEDRIVANRLSQTTYYPPENDYHSIAHFESLAVLEWLTRVDRDPTPAVIARHLGFDAQKVASVLKILVSSGYVRQNPEGRYLRTRKRVIVKADIDHSLLKEIHRRALTGAVVALKDQSPVTRFSATEFITVDESDLATLREITLDYLKRLQSLAARSSQGERLYTVTAHLFRQDSNQEEGS